MNLIVATRQGRLGTSVVLVGQWQIRGKSEILGNFLQSQEHSKFDLIS